MSLYFPSNRRSGLAEAVITLCWITLICLVIWFALAHFRQMQLSPQLRAAATALDKKNVDLARRDFDAALKGNSDNPDTYKAIYLICNDHKQWDLGADYLRRGIQACKDQSKSVRAELHSLLATLLTEADPEPPQKEAIESAERALELTPDDPEMLNQLGYLLADNNQELDTAEDYIVRALRLASENKDSSPMGQMRIAEIEDSYGWVLYRKGNYAGAANALTQAIQDIPDSSLPREVQAQIGDTLKVCYYHLGAASHKAGRLAEARRAHRMALQYDPDYAPAKSELALLPPESAPASAQTPSAPAALSSPR
jgi:tetratricopeptide (TPR) repeat protein